MLQAAWQQNGNAQSASRRFLIHVQCLGSVVVTVTVTAGSVTVCVVVMVLVTV
jgi:hypothetical protein